MRLSLLLILLVAIVSSRRIRCWPTPYKKALLGISFFLLFLLTDGSATASQSWGGAPPTYWPVGLAIALLLYAGSEAAPLVFVSGLVAAVLNYHRNIFGWCGIPGVAALYGWYLVAALALRRRWRIDPELSTLRDVRRYVVAFLTAEFFSSITGMLTLLGDHLIQPTDAAKTTAEWWASDAIALLTFTPMLLVFVIPRVDRWLRFPPGDPAGSPYRWPSRSKLLEMCAQFGSGVLAIWIVFGVTSAIPYQPLYLLFIPLIWMSVRHGLRGAAFSVFAINVGLTFAAWITQAPRGSTPRLQFAMIGLGLTGLCLGAIVSEGKRGEEELRPRLSALRKACTSK